MEKRGSQFLVLLTFLLLVFSFLTPVYAEEGPDSTSDDGLDDSNTDSDEDANSDDSDEDDDTEDDEDDELEDEMDEDESEDDSDDETENEDEEGDSSEEKVETRKWSGNNKERKKEKRTFFDENGNKIIEEIKTETKDGETKTTVKRKILSEDGSQITFKIKTETKDGVEKITKTIESKGVEAETELEIEEKLENGVSKIKVKLSSGEEQEISVLPDEALQTAFEEIQTSDEFEFELEEVEKSEGKKAVFSAKAKHKGKLFGFISTEFDSETFVDAETGEVIETNRPWWTFMVKKSDKAEVCHISDDDSTKRNSLSVGVSAVKAHLAHGDTIGECLAECGDEILTEGEVCELGTSQQCTTSDGGPGLQVCNVDCAGFDECLPFTDPIIIAGSTA